MINSRFKKGLALILALTITLVFMPKFTYADAPTNKMDIDVNDPNIGNLDVSNITDMSALFMDKKTFNADIGKWNTSNVISMNSMFKSAMSFNQDINNWNTSKVLDMSNMFSGAKYFNQNISRWDTSNVRSMSNMFAGTILFNQNLNTWDTSNVSNMSRMFYIADSFNKRVDNWDTSKVSSMDWMFYRCKSFNQDISDWDTSNVKDMSGMFNECKSIKIISLLNRGNAKDTKSVFIFHGTEADKYEFKGLASFDFPVQRDYNIINYSQKKYDKVKSGETYKFNANDQYLVTVEDVDYITKEWGISSEKDEKNENKEDKTDKKEHSSDYEDLIKTKHKFDDLAPSRWYMKGINYVVNSKIMNGVSETNFAPNEAITKAMLVTMLHRLSKDADVANDIILDDVKDGSWYAKSSKWAVKNKIAIASEGSFDPKHKLSREEFLNIIYNYAMYKKLDITQRADLSKYKDSSAIDSKYKDAFEWAVKEGLVEGISGDEISPKTGATRAQMATIFMRFIEAYK